MKKVFSHIVIPAIVPVLFFIAAFMPVGILGCRTRSIVVSALALAGAVGALATTMIGAKKKLQDDKNYLWWLASTAILVIPPLALLILA